MILFTLIYSKGRRSVTFHTPMDPETKIQVSIVLLLIMVINYIYYCNSETKEANLISAEQHVMNIFSFILNAVQVIFNVIFNAVQAFC